MQNIIVEVSVPSISGQFDFKLPSEGRIKDVISEIAYIIESTQKNVHFNVDDLILCDKNNKKILNKYDLIAEAGLHDNTQLILL